MIPLVDLKRQYKTIETQIKSAVLPVFQKGDYILGEELEEFEKNFSKYCQTKYAVGVASGTDSILLALRALGIGNNDEVITVANTFISTILPILYVKAKPVLIDIDPDTYNIAVDKIEEKITKKTKVILPVHLYGSPADMGPILRLAEKYGLSVIEDACQAHGAIYKGKKVGSFGDMACFSFYPGKNLGCYGDGGMVVTNSKNFAEKIKILRNVGQEKKYHHVELGYNSRLDTIQAAVLNVKLKFLDEWNKKRRILASHYNNLLRSLPIKTPLEKKDVVSNYHLYVIRVEKRDDLLKYLKQNSINCGIHYPIPVHLQKCLEDLGYEEGDFPVTEKYAREIISLPMFPELKKEEVKKIVSFIKKFYGY